MENSGHKCRRRERCAVFQEDVKVNVNATSDENVKVQKVLKPISSRG